MAIDDILRVCPPPANPIQVPTDAEWRALEADIGLSLPTDYKAFLSRYGSGGFGSDERDGFFDLSYVLSPGAPDDKHGQNAIPWMRRLTEDIHEIQQRFPHLVPFATRPADGGLVYVGGTTTQHCLYWKTSGSPDTWTLAVCDRPCDHWFEWNGDVTSLLAAIAERRVPEWITQGPTRFPLVFRDTATLEQAPLV
jgi:hypothetical protein